MSTAAAWRAGVASDPGLQRSNNEDRVFVDESAGIFLVVDGVGGQAAGEKAAEVAVEVIPRELATEEGPPEHRVRAAIAAANNEIFQLAQSHPEWRGMACVLTLAYADDGRITVGHVGDSRMYLAWDGKLRKLTSDHSPVGEQEDRGELTEAEAMKHPRRNEVFRDVGSRVRDAYEEDFIEARSFPFHSDAAFLICSDGLSDVVPSADISAIIETFDGDPDAVTHQLIEAANLGGGKDNISVVFVAGPEFTGSGAQTLKEARSRHAITRPRRTGIQWRKLAGRLLWLAAGILLGIGFWTALPPVLPRFTPSAGNEAVRGNIVVNPADPRGIVRALASAKAGDTVEVPAGEYAGPIELKDGVNLLSEQPRAAVIHADASGIAVVVRGAKSGRLSGFRLEGTAANPMRVGLLLADSSLDADDLEITGARDCGIRIQGISKGVLRANYIHDNPGCGISIAGPNATRLAGNRVSANGTVAGALRRGIEILPPAAPLLDNNIVSGNGIRDLGILPPEYERELRRRNLMDETAAPAARH
jgi:serine/threonine protein phosphatase PrpC